MKLSLTLFLMVMAFLAGYAASFSAPENGFVFLWVAFAVLTTFAIGTGLAELSE